MGRRPRVFVPGYPHHVVQRGHNRNAVFVEPADYEYYLSNLREWKDFYDVAVYAYCLMTNHVHLMLSPRADGLGISGLMRRLSARQGRYVNCLEGRSGSPFQLTGVGRAVPQMMFVGHQLSPRRIRYDWPNGTSPEGEADAGFRIVSVRRAAL